MEEAKFRGIMQASKETAREFALRLRVQASRCTFGEQTSELVRQFAHGNTDADVKVRFLEGKLTSLDQLIKKADKQ